MEEQDEYDHRRVSPEINGHHKLSNGISRNGRRGSEREFEENGYGSSDDNAGQDGPLDFSVKRKRTHSESDDSRSSYNSSNLPHIKAESPDPHELHSNAPSPGEITRDSRGDLTKSPTAAAMAAMGLFPGMMGNGSAMLNNLPASVVAMMDPRSAMNGQKNSRPFKAYPKEALSMPVGYYGMPGYMPFPGMDANVLQGLGLSSEELMSMYKQQLSQLRERDKNGGKHSGHSNGNTSSGSSSNGDTTPHTTPNHSNTSPSSGIPSLPPHLAAARATMVSSTSGSSGANRRRPRTLPDEQKDEAYWERRRKNNDAAKRSRDARRAKEDEIAIRAALLEQENLKLRVEVAALKSETARLKCMLYNN